MWEILQPIIQFYNYGLPKKGNQLQQCKRLIPDWIINQKYLSFQSVWDLIEMTFEPFPNKHTHTLLLYFGRLIKKHEKGFHLNLCSQIRKRETLLFVCVFCLGLIFLLNLYKFISAWHLNFIFVFHLCLIFLNNSYKLFCLCVPFLSDFPARESDFCVCV